MPSNIRRHVFAALALLTCALSGAFVSGAQPTKSSSLVEPGVVLEVFDAGSAPHRTGLQPGDILLSWRRTGPPIPGRPTSGTFQSPLDWRVFELEEAPRGPYSVTIQRGSKRFTLPASPGMWSGHNIDTIVNARFAGRGLEAWERGLMAVGQTYGLGLGLIEGMILGELRVAGKPVGSRPKPETMAVLDERLRDWRHLADDLHQAGDYETEAWLRWRLDLGDHQRRCDRGPLRQGSPIPIPVFSKRAKQEFSRALSALAGGLGHSISRCATHVVRARDHLGRAIRTASVEL